MKRFIDEPLIFEESSPGLRGTDPWISDVPAPAPDSATARVARKQPMLLPEVSEMDVVRHFTRLSRMNASIDEAMYPLGSCTMKYNPRLNEDMAVLEGFADTHPLQPAAQVQGNLEVLERLGSLLARLTGMDHASLQPVAGAQGEFAGLLMIRAFLTSQGDPRKVILVPDSAHGTNPATATMCGYTVAEVRSGEDGCLDLDDLRKHLTPEVAGMMMTVPNTLGIFEKNIGEICRLMHANGSQVYVDGANMNALMGATRPGDWGADVMHMNLHKTFSTPHGGGGPGAGAIMFKAHLEPFQPTPALVRGSDGLHWDHERPHSVGRLHASMGNFGILVRAACYGLTLGGNGLAAASAMAVLNNNYLRARLKDTYGVCYSGPTLHETVYTDQGLPNGVTTMDVAKRLIDFGFHPMTVYFPLIAKGAMMVEPTETEPQRELDRLADALIAIAAEAAADPGRVKSAPHSTYRRRLDETTAARKPVLTWRADGETP